MPAGKANYYDTVNTLSRTESIHEAQSTIMQILWAIDAGDLNPPPRYKWILNNALQFINAYYSYDPDKFILLPNSYARMKLTIVQWWNKTQMHTDGVIYPIEFVERTVTDDAATLSKILNQPVAEPIKRDVEPDSSINTDVKKLIYAFHEWIEDERDLCIEYTRKDAIEDARKMAARKRARQEAKHALNWNAESLKRAAQLEPKQKVRVGRRTESSRFYIGSECPICGNNKRYRSNSACVECKQRYNATKNPERVRTKKHG